MATHIESLNIKSFRGLEDLKIENLGDVNIIVGDNNTGKTSVLEAIQFIGEPTEHSMIKIARQREWYKGVTHAIGLVDSIRYLFHIKSKKENEYNLEISAEINGEYAQAKVTGKDELQIRQIYELEDGSKRMRNTLKNFRDIELHLQDEVEEVDTFIGKIKVDNKDITFEFNKYSIIVKVNYLTLMNVIFTQAMEHVAKDSFRNLTRRADLSKKAVKLLKEFDTRVVDIRYVGEGEQKFIPVFEVEGMDEYVPLSLYGDGVKKALTVLNAIIEAENGVVLIDEFETSLHTTAMDHVFKFMVGVAKELNVQLFLTTHSMEAIDTLLRCDEENINKIKVVRIRKDENEMYTDTISGDEALRIRKKYKMELRL